MLDDSHKTFELTAPEGDDINDIEVVAEFIGVTGKPDPQFPPIPVKEKGHAEQTNDAGQSGESHSDESVSDPEHPEDSHPADAGVQDAGSDAERIGEASDEQDTGSEPATGETETVGGAHHKPRRPKHA